MDISPKMNQKNWRYFKVAVRGLCFKDLRENILKMNENIGNLRRGKKFKNQKVIL